MKNKTFHLVASAVLGVLFWIIGQFIYPVFTQKIWQPLGIALYFITLAVFLVIGLAFLASLRNDIVFWSQNKSVGKYDELKISAILLCVLFILTIGLEFIYELGGDYVTHEPTSYVFLIDDSGSMAGTDPDFIRASAINDIMNEQKDIPYAVYSFTSVVNLLKDVSLYNPSDNYSFNSDGGTAIVPSLDEVVTNIINNKSSMYGAYPKILLLSDGNSSSYGVGSVIDRCNDNNIAVSTISFGSFFENALLRKIAYKTGGEFLKVSDAQNLGEGMKLAINSTHKRNLISDRFVRNYDWLYLVLRILFLAIMGCIWSIIKANMCFTRDKDGYRKIMKVSIGCCTVAAIAVEVLYKLGLSQQIIHLLLCVLWALTPVKIYTDQRGTPGKIDLVNTNNTDFKYEQYNKDANSNSSDTTNAQLSK